MREEVAYEVLAAHDCLCCLYVALRTAAVVAGAEIGGIDMLLHLPALSRNSRISSSLLLYMIT